MYVSVGVVFSSTIISNYIISNLSGDFVSQEHGVPHDGPQRFERRGLYTWDLDHNETRRGKPRDAGEHNARQRETPRFTQVQDPRGEVKPLLPAFLYYDAIPHEEYKALVTEL
jgi:hypothetical protein